MVVSLLAKINKRSGELHRMARVGIENSQESSARAAKHRAEGSLSRCSLCPGLTFSLGLPAAGI